MKSLEGNFNGRSSPMDIVKRVFRCDLAQRFCIIFGVLLFELSCLQENKHYAGGTDVNAFRFRDSDFEPRSLHLHAANVTFKRKMANFHKKYFDELDSRRYGHQNGTNSRTDREGRGFHFHSTDWDTTVDAEFIIPFMSVPIKSGMKLTKAAFRNLLDLRTSSLLWTGAFVAVGTLVASAVNTIGVFRPIFFPVSSLSHHKKRMHDFTGKREHGIMVDEIKNRAYLEDNPYDIGSKLDEIFMQYDFDLNVCMQKVICRYVERAASDIRAGKASGTQKIIDGFASARLLSKYYSGTAVQIAIEAGQSSNCHKWAKRCKLPNFETSKFVNFIFKYLNG